MSPQMMRFFSLVAIALAAASMQLKARAETSGWTAAPAACVAADAWRS
jgi:hypothetical protein